MTWLGEILNPLGLNWIETLTAVLLLGAVTVGGTLLTALWLVKVPADFFCAHRANDFWTRRHPIVRWGGRVLKNLLGASLIVLGIILSLPGVPGPGVLTMLFGVTLLDFPGKRRLERWLIGRPAVLSAVNRLRQRYGKPPVVLEPRPAKCEP